MANVPGNCPTCSGVLVPQELQCRSCATVVRGNWDATPFARLSGDQEAFLILFVRSRGNLSEVERALGVSYPTVRAKLEEVISALADHSDRSDRDDSVAPSRRELLDRVARGELSAGEALDLLRERNRNGSE